MQVENEIARQVVDAAFQVHTRLGPGLLETVYQTVLAHEMRKRELIVETEVPIPVQYDGVILEVGFRADMVVKEWRLCVFAPLRERSVFSSALSAALRESYFSLRRCVSVWFFLCDLRGSA